MGLESSMDYHVDVSSATVLLQTVPEFSPDRLWLAKAPESGPILRILSRKTNLSLAEANDLSYIQRRLRRNAVVLYPVQVIKR